MTFTIASVNVNGIRAACKQRSEENLGFNHWLAQTSADVVLMQEVRATPKQTEAALAPAMEAGWSHLAMSEAEAKGRAGVGILSRTPLSEVSVGFGSFAAGRYIEASVEKEGESFRVASLYLPSGAVGTEKQDEKYRFLDEFAQVLAERPASYPNMVIGGDWNICHRAQDLKNNKSNEKKSGHLPEERAFMDHVFGAFPDPEPQVKKGLGDYFGAVEYAGNTAWQASESPQWFDVVRRLHPDADGPYSWWTYRGQAFNNDAGWRIDYQAATKPMLDRAERTWVDRADSVEMRWSDHSPVVVEYR